MEIDLHFLQKKWIHAHEEDTSELLVFRPETYPFGLSRGRDAIEFHANGKVTRVGIAPNDTLSFSEGKWMQQGQSSVRVTRQSEEISLLEIAWLAPDKLVIKK